MTNPNDSPKSSLRRSREEAEALFLENMKLVYYVANRMDITVTDDVIQDGYIGLWKAAMMYDQGKAKSFTTYAVPAIRNSISYARRASAKSIQTDLSLEQHIDGDGSWMLQESVPDPKWTVPTENAEFRIYIDKLLTDEEKQVACMRTSGASQRAIGASFGRSDAWVIERLKRIKSKLKRDYAERMINLG